VRSGLTIEIGGGIGNLRHWLSNVVVTDIQFAPWLDCVADAQYLPFADGAAANIVMVDVLHHVEFPSRFFREAERLLRPGGRIIMVERRLLGGAPCSTVSSTMSWSARLPIRWLRELQVRAATPMTPTRPFLP